MTNSRGSSLTKLASVAASLAMLAGCEGAVQINPHEASAPQRIVSLDYCSDQYVLRFADREDILALSMDAQSTFSYMRGEAEGIRQVRPRTADVLSLEPDLIVRSYGGGPNVNGFMERAGIPVVQLGFPSTIADVREEVLRVGKELGQAEKAGAVVADMDQRLAELAQRAGKEADTLYMTPAGVTAGEGTLIHELIAAAGHSNFQDERGWNPIPLERLAYERPDLVAASFFESKTNHVDNWSAARHPIAQAQLRELPVVTMEGAWTACGGWFLLDAVEALAKAHRSKP